MRGLRPRPGDAYVPANQRLTGEHRHAFRILVVDDDESYLVGMKELLELRGHEPLLARTFEEGQRALQAGGAGFSDCRRAARSVQRSPAARDGASQNPHHCRQRLR